jgi:hypothetical protein
VSVAVEAGLADRLTGMVTQLWLAVLSRRAIAALTYGDLPGFGAACDAPHFDWLQPPPGLPPDAVDPLKYTYRGVRGYGGDRSYPPSVNGSEYHPLYMINAGDLKWMETTNLSRLPEKGPETPYVISSSNRGRSYAIANNPYHKATFAERGVPPDDAFMCGFFWLCWPNAAVQAYYQQFWEPLSDRAALKIGLQIRTGDGVFRGEAVSDAAKAAALSRGASYFECAQGVEDLHKLPGQKVIWFINSDSVVLRIAAKEKYGDKVLTDTTLKMVHPDCKGQNPGACGQSSMDASFQHSLGSMITFAMLDYHVVTVDSGFGRLGSYMSGRWGNDYELRPGEKCDPKSPLPKSTTNIYFAGVRKRA